MISCFFATGTGRCGTKLVSELFSLHPQVTSHHEHSVETTKMKKAFIKNKPEIVNKPLAKILYPQVQQINQSGRIYAEVSGHLYLSLPELYRYYESGVRFMLLVRQPEGFVRSALARGFFSPGHRNKLEHVIAPLNTEIGARWNTATPFEKCSWYWATVNSRVLQFFMTLPPEMWRIVPIEYLTLEKVKALYDFLGLDMFDSVKDKVQDTLTIRHNASPGQGETTNINPYSDQINIDSSETWNDELIKVFHRHVVPMNNILYPEKNLTNTDSKDIDHLQLTLNPLSQLC